MEATVWFDLIFYCIKKKQTRQEKDNESTGNVINEIDDITKINYNAKKNRKKR